jgi:acyl dehydratase
MTIDQKFVGKKYPITTYEIGKEKVKEFVKAIKGDPDKFSKVVHPTFHVVYGSSLLEAVLFDQELNLNLAKLVHGEQEFVYHKPVNIGDTISCSGSIDKIFNKGSHDFVTFKVSGTNQNGEHVCDSIAVFIVRGGNDKDFSFVEKLMMKINSLLPSTSNKGTGSQIYYSPVYEQSGNQENMSVIIDKYMPQKYAGASGDFNAIHLDDQLGKSAGLGGYILHGMATMGLGANLAMRHKEASAIKRYKVRFSAPVKPLDKLFFEGLWSGEGKKFSFGAKNQSGIEVLSSCVAEFYY